MLEHRMIPHFVYRLRDEDGHLLYVGCTKNVALRMKQWSTSLHEWTYCVRSVHVTPYPNRLTARAAESAAIKDEHPLWNVLGRYPRYPLDRCAA